MLLGAHIVMLISIAASLLVLELSIGIPHNIAQHLSLAAWR